MSISGIILAAVVVGGTGLVISILLGIASEKFKVPVDEKEVERRYDHKAHERAEGSGVDVDGRHGGEVVVEDDLDHAADEHRENRHMHAAVGLQDGV